jgi:hypothetical protein
MADATQYVFSYREVAEMLVRKQGITEGIWGLYVRFSLAAVNVGPSDESLQPAAIVPLAEIGIQRFEKLNNLSVDAADLARRDAEVQKRGRE